jgi:type I restriction enzyme, S subunit
MWDKFCLKQLGCFNELKNGYAFKSSDYQKSGIPLIKIGNFKNCRLDYSQCDYLPEYFINDYSKFLLREDDLIIAMSGATTGKIAVVNKKNLPAFLNQRVGNLGFLKRDIICESYLPYVEIQIKKQLMALAPGSAMPNISKGIIERLQILLPPLDEQRRIVARIEELAAKVEEARGLRRQSAEEAEVLINSALILIFEKQILKQGWNLQPLREGAEISRGKFAYRPRNEPKFYGGNIPFIQIGDISKSNRYIQDYSQTLNQDGLKISRMFAKGTVVLAITGATIGVTGILGFDSCFPDSIVGITPHPNITISEFIYWSVEYVKKIALSEATQTTQPNINLKNIEKLNIPVPPLPEQRHLVAYLDDLQAKVDALKRLQTQTAAELDALLPSILDKAFKGEL